jgi:hypothetical protein
LFAIGSDAIPDRRIVSIAMTFSLTTAVAAG